MQERRTVWGIQIYCEVILVSIFILLAARGLSLGFGSHGDSREIFDVSVSAILQGHYSPSRSYGVPLFEGLAALLYPLGGLMLVNLASAVMSVAALLVFLRLLREQRGLEQPWTALAAFAALSFNPLVLIEASSPTEWAAALLSSILAIRGTARWLEHRRGADLALYGVSIAATVLVRPDFAIFGIALFLTVAWHLGNDRRALLTYLAASVAAGLVTLAIFLALNGGPELFLKAAAIAGTEALSRRIIVAAGGLLVVFGGLGLIAVMLLLAPLAVETIRSRGKSLAFIEKLAIVLWPIEVIRFVALPDKLEYLLPLIPVTLLCLMARRRSVWIVVTITGSLVASSILTVSLLERNRATDSIGFALHVNRSALVQDWDARKAVNLALSPTFRSQLADRVFGKEVGINTVLKMPNYGLGYTTVRGDLITSRWVAYKLDNPRFPMAGLSSASYRRIFVCDRIFVADNIGWRVMQPPPVFADPEAAITDANTHCEAEPPKSP